MISSFHLVHFRRKHVFQSKRTDNVAGLRFWKPLSIGPDFKALPDDFGRWALAKPNFKRWGFFAIWEDEAALDAFLSESPISQQWNENEVEVWQVRLKPAHTSGTWHGANPLGEIGTHEPSEGPVAMLTRGELHLRKVPTFWLSTTMVAVNDVLEVPGFLAGVALVERPFMEVMTFTLWNSTDDVMEFARNRPAHSGLIERDRTENIFRAFFYAHFKTYRSEGTWHGQDPLTNPKFPARRQAS